MKKIHLFISFIALAAGIVGCKENDGPIFEIEGVWVEQADRSDTVAFERIDGGSWLSLKRGREIVNGHDLPKYGSGLYNYQIKGDSISMLSMHSSCSNCFETYYFKLKGKELHIGDFYKKNSASLQPLIFVKK